MTADQIQDLAAQLVERGFSMMVIPDGERAGHRWQLYPLTDEAMLQLENSYPSFSTPQAALAWFNDNLE